MKRSDINRIIEESAAFIASFGYRLPPFAFLGPDVMRARRAEIAGIVDARLGWDITDYGAGDFGRTGLTLFTVRNGRAADLARGRGMLYAEKIMISRRDQLAPMHRHEVKAEDIINRGGGTLALRLFMSAPDGSIDRTAPVSVPTDGVARKLDAGGVLIGEVSTVNDDETDNFFEEPVARFAEVEEDVTPTRLLVSDYRTWLG